MSEKTSWWQGWWQRYQSVVEEYGNAAIGTYFAIFFATLLGFWVAMRYGFEVSGTAAQAGTIGAAYFATKMTQPIRIGATVVITPAMVRVVRRIRKTETELPAK